MQLSEKPKFLESTLNFENFKESEPHSSSISEVIDSKDVLT